MAEPIIIDVIIQAINRTGQGTKAAAKALSGVEQAAKRTAEGTGRVGTSAKQADSGLRQVEKSSKKAKSGLDQAEKSSRQVQRSLRELSRERYLILLEARDRVSPALGKVRGGLKGLTRAAWTIPLRVADYATRPIRGVLSLLGSVQGLVFGAAGTAGGLVAPMDIAGDYEQTEIAFSTMLKSQEKARKFLAEASAFANETPFEFPDLIDSSKLLLAFGFDPDAILPMLTTIGDASSGLGAGAAGIDRITRALGQIQAKGRVLTEELMQLQEVGIPVNQILQEELGLTQEQVANIGDEGVKSEDAIAGLLRGMEKRYGGMMENQSRTAKGLMSTISDTMQNTFMRSWGTGLWAGFKPGLEKITGWFNENPEKVQDLADRLEELGKSFSTTVMGYAEQGQKAISGLADDPAWQGADFFGKAELAWNRLIAEPFDEWWKTEGKERLTDTAGDMGDFIGSMLNRGIMALLGDQGDGLLKDGVSAGAAFSEGFLEGFEPGKVKEAVLGAVKGIFEDSFFGGGSSSTTWLSTLLVGGLGLKGLGIGAEIGSGVYHTVSAAHMLGKLFKPAAAGKAAAGKAGAGAAAAGISLPAAASVVGGILGLMGLGASVKDLQKAGRSPLTWEQDRHMRRGLTKGGLVLGGAAAGAAVGSVVPGLGTLVGGLVGAGLGGAGALLGGNSLAEFFKTGRERAHEELLRLGDDLEDALDGYEETMGKTGAARGLLGEYQELQAYMDSADFDDTRAEAVQERMKQILGDLQAMFPGLISSYETVNGLSDDRVKGLENELGLMDEQAERSLRQTVTDTRERLPQIGEDYGELERGLAGNQAEWERVNAYRGELNGIFQEYQEVLARGGSEEELYDLIGQADRLSQKYGMGDRFDNSAKIGTTAEELRERSKELNAQQEDMLKQKADLDAQMQKYYDSSVQLIWKDTGIGAADFQKAKDGIEALSGAMVEIEKNGGVSEETRALVEEILPGFSQAQDAAVQMDTLKQGIEGMTDSIAPALEQIDTLNRSLKELPDEKKIWISVGYGTQEQVKGLSAIGNASALGAAGGVMGAVGIASAAVRSGLIEKHAFGGLVNGPRLSWIGEDGPEAIIPLSGKYRSRGLKLYEQAGQYLGIGRNAEGGVYSTTGSPKPAKDPSSSLEGGGSLTVQVSAPIQIQPGTSNQETLGRFTEEWARVGDQILEELARRLGRARENMPGGAM